MLSSRFTGSSRIVLRSRDGAVALALFVAFFLVGFGLRTNLHDWGDDFAGYLLQARALSTGSQLREFAHNGALSAASDVSIGPIATPWGLPLILWGVGSTFGWSFVTLKVVGIVALALLSAAAFFLSRVYLPRWPSVAVAATIALTPDVTESINVVSTDLPFLALSTVALFLIERSMRHELEVSRTKRAILLVGIAIVSTIAFSLRTNGIFLFGCAGVALIIRAMKTKSVREFTRDSVVLSVVSILGVAAYFLLLPDGSHTQTQFLDFSIASIARRSRETVFGMREFVPFVWWSSTRLGSVGAAATMFLALGLAIRGVWRARPYSLVQVVWLLLNGVLLAVYKFFGGTRYEFPFAVTIYIFAAAGLIDLARKHLPVVTQRWRLRLFAATVATAWAAGLTADTVTGYDSERAFQRNGPFSPGSQQLFSFIRKSTSPTARLAFFKPRALRYFTGRDVVRINFAKDVGSVDYLVLYRRPEALLWERQVDTTKVTGVSLNQVFADDDAVVYRVVK
jgi:hypothetical protein